MKKKTYIIIDPQHDYALSLIDIIAAAYDMRPLCLYTDRRSEFYARAYFPGLQGHRVEASFYLEDIGIAELCAHLQERYDIVGIVPYFEKALQPAADLLEHLDLQWNTPAVVRRFRDKYALKDFLRKNFPAVPMNQSRPVRSASDVFASPLPERYVIKPNDGYANRDVGFFASTDPKARVEEYFSGNQQGTYVLEEFLDGPEYAVNGQLDHQGQASIINIIEYERRAGNGRANLYHRTHHIRQTDPAFAPIATYTAAVMEASGLKRSPFHAEIMLTQNGPRLIEVGARLGGAHYAYMANALHGGKFNIFALAAHYYLFNTPYPGPQPDWEYYNRIGFMHVDGCSPTTEMVYRVDGIKAIEKLPEFHAWVIKPVVGEMIYRTVDLLTVPYAFHLRGFLSREELAHIADKAAALIKINSVNAPVQKLYARAKNTLRRARKKGAWLMHSLINKRGLIP